MTLKEQYKKETNLEVYILDPFTGDFDNTKYVEWLEAKINYTHCCKSDSEQLDADFISIVCKEAHFYKDGKIFKKEKLKFSD